MSIEDEIFLSSLETQKLKRTKQMYERAILPHICSMCLEDPQIKLAYRLKLEYVSDFNTPYLYICGKCYEELPND